MPADLDLVRRLARADRGLAVVAVARTDGSVHASLVNAGVLAHPATGKTILALVASMMRTASLSDLSGGRLKESVVAAKWP